jgi:hypothetical protein
MVLEMTSFQCDVTPPIGFPLCAGWYPEAHTIGDRLEANGIVITAADQPAIVLCALDWAELSNYEHLRWREALAAAADTDADHVAVHCTHCHDSPWPDSEAQDLLNRHGNPDIIQKDTWANDIRLAVAESAKAAMQHLQKCSHVSTGQERVIDIASNRRVMENDKVKGVRWTHCSDPEIKNAPEGLIDPYLKTISFWNEDKKLAALHYYTTHPTSIDGTGIVTSEFVGLARKKISVEENIPHLYFTSCAGNITAGKYNNCDTESRERFTNEIYRAMKTSEAGAQRQPLKSIAWHLENIHLPARPDVKETDASDAMDYDALLEAMSKDRKARRSRAALIFTYRDRVGKLPIPVTALHINEDIRILHLPGEAFIEYQHFACEQKAGAFTCVASYGDLGPGYICMQKSFDEGGYEPRDAFCAAASESIMKNAIEKVIKA